MESYVQRMVIKPCYSPYLMSHLPYCYSFLPCFGSFFFFRLSCTSFARLKISSFTVGQRQDNQIDNQNNNTSYSYTDIGGNDNDSNNNDYDIDDDDYSGDNDNTISSCDVATAAKRVFHVCSSAGCTAGATWNWMALEVLQQATSLESSFCCINIICGYTILLCGVPMTKCVCASTYA